MREKPRLLFLAYDFPPINTIGAVRAYNVAKWLTRKGWEVTVVSPKESAWGLAGGATDLHEDLSRQGIRCMRTEHRWRALLPAAPERRRNALAWASGGVSRRVANFFGIERETGWFREAEKACSGLTPEDVDVVVASGPPFASFGLAKRVAARLGRPYVMDYRDLWTGNPHARRPPSPLATERERGLLAGSAAATGVSPSVIQSLREQLGTRTRLHVISNGFDPAEMAQVAKFGFGHFAIVYAGMFYPPKRTVGPVMAALQRLEQISGKEKPWMFHYYGNQGDYVLKNARDFKIENRVVVHGNVPRADALAAVRSASVAVVISSVFEQGSVQDKGIVTGKVFEGIGLGTPLLVIAPEGSDLEGILAVTGCGRRFAGTAIDRIAGFLQDAMNGRAALNSNPDPFNWSNIADQLDDVLRAAVGVVS